MLSFHGKQEIKDKYLSRIIDHRKADRLIKGTGWENGKGCAVGCTLEKYDHSLYPIELGLPEWLAHLQDTIFEELPNDLAMTWPERFLSAIPVGVDVEIVKHQLAIKRLDRLIESQKKNNIKENLKEQVIKALNLVRGCHSLFVNNEYVSESAWFAARSAAESAARSAWSAAGTAANSAVWSAAFAAESAAESVAYMQESENLLELLSNLKQGEKA